MNTNHLTVELLTQVNACQSAITFLKQHNLENFPLDRINEVKGDYDDYINWIKDNIINPGLQFDDNGNLVYEKDKNGYWFKYSYDHNNNLVYKEYKNGYWVKRKYDQNNNLVYREDKYSDISTYDYHYYDNGQLKEMMMNNKAILEIPLI